MYTKTASSSATFFIPSTNTWYLSSWDIRYRVYLLARQIVSSRRVREQCSLAMTGIRLLFINPDSLFDSSTPADSTYRWVIPIQSSSASHPRQSLVCKTGVIEEMKPLSPRPRKIRRQIVYFSPILNTKLIPSIIVFILVFAHLTILVGLLPKRGFRHYDIE